MQVLTREQLQRARTLAQVDRKFIAVVAGDTLALVDQHAADERVQLERMRDEVSLHLWMVSPGNGTNGKGTSAAEETPAWQSADTARDGADLSSQSYCKHIGLVLHPTNLHCVSTVQARHTSWGALLMNAISGCSNYSSGIFEVLSCKRKYAQMACKHWTATVCLRIW